MKTEKKTVLITGGASGIGLALAKSFLEAGSQVIICGRSIDKLEKAQREFPDLNIASCDVTDQESIAQLHDYCESTFDGIDILINNAGVMNWIDYQNDKPSIDQQINEIAIDLIGPIQVTSYFLSGLMNKEESAIVNVSSGLAFVPATYMPVYSAAKAGLHSWTQSLRSQLSSTSVKVFELMPPFVRTDMVDRFEGQSMMSGGELASYFMKAFKKGQLEIIPGPARLLKWISRFFPSLASKQLNKQLSK